MLTTTPFYFSSIRGLTAIFGTLFNNVSIVRYNADGSVNTKIKVPLAYAPADKTITMLQQVASSREVDGLDHKITLPRMSFELAGMSYDSNRKTPSTIQNVYAPAHTLNFSGSNASIVNVSTATITATNHGIETGRGLFYSFASGGSAISGLTAGKYYAIAVDKNSIRLATSESNAYAGTAVPFFGLGTGTQTLKSYHVTQYNAVPYNFEYNLNIFVKYIDDGLQIIEQIAPYFTPHYSVTKKDMLPYGINRDVNFVINSITTEDIYEGDIAEDRIIQWTVAFTANSWIYPPISDASIIKSIDVNFYDLGNTQKLATVGIDIDPPDADKDDNYTINTTITEY